MINRVKALFAERGGRPHGGGERHSDEELRLAAAALLVEAALMDDCFDQAERETVRRLLGARFGLAPEEADDLIAEAESAVAESAQLHAFTRVVKDHFSQEERVGLIEMLWEVAYADGELHDFEASLLRRVGGLIYVTDRERGAARKRVMARLGLTDGPLPA